MITIVNIINDLFGVGRRGTYMEFRGEIVAIIVLTFNK